MSRGQAPDSTKSNISGNVSMLAQHPHDHAKCPHRVAARHPGQHAGKLNHCVMRGILFFCPACLLTRFSFLFGVQATSCVLGRWKHSKSLVQCFCKELEFCFLMLTSELQWHPWLKCLYPFLPALPLSSFLEDTPFFSRWPTLSLAHYSWLLSLVATFEGSETAVERCVKKDTHVFLGDV